MFVVTISSTIFVTRATSDVSYEVVMRAASAAAGIYGHAMHIYSIKPHMRTHGRYGHMGEGIKHDISIPPAASHAERLNGYHIEALCHLSDAMRNYAVAASPSPSFLLFFTYHHPCHHHQMAYSSPYHHHMSPPLFSLPCVTTREAHWFIPRKYAAVFTAQ